MCHYLCSVLTFSVQNRHLLFKMAILFFNIIEGQIQCQPMKSPHMTSHLNVPLDHFLQNGRFRFDGQTVEGQISTVTQKIRYMTSLYACNTKLSKSSTGQFVHFRPFQGHLISSQLEVIQGQQIAIYDLLYAVLNVVIFEIKIENY